MQQHKHLHVDQTRIHQDMAKVAFCKAQKLQPELMCLPRIMLPQPLASKREDQGQCNQPPDIRTILETLRFPRVGSFEAELEHGPVEQGKVKVNVIEVDGNQRVCKRPGRKEVANSIWVWTSFPVFPSIACSLHLCTRALAPSAVWVKAISTTGWALFFIRGVRAAIRKALCCFPAPIVTGSHGFWEPG